MTHTLTIAERQQAVQRLAGFHYLTVNPGKIQHNMPQVSFPEFVRQLIANSAGAGATDVVLRVKADAQRGCSVLDYQDNGASMCYETHVQVFGQGVSEDASRPYSNKGTGLNVAMVSNVDICISMASTSATRLDDSKATGPADRSIVMFAPAAVEGKSSGYFHWDLPGDFCGKTLQDYYTYIKGKMGAESPEYRMVLRDARDGAGYLLREDLGHENAPFADFAALLACFEKRDVVGLNGMRFLMWPKGNVASAVQEAVNPKLQGSMDILCRSMQDTFLSTVASNMFLGSDLLAILLPGTPPRPPLYVTFGEAKVTIRGANTPAVDNIEPAVGPQVCEARALKGPDGQEYARYIKYAGDKLTDADFAGLRGAMLVYDQDYVMSADGFCSHPPNAMASQMENMLRDCDRRSGSRVKRRNMSLYGYLLELLQWDEATKPAGWSEELFAKVILRYGHAVNATMHARTALRHIMELAGAYRFLVMITDHTALMLDATKQGLENDSNGRLWLDMLRDSAQEVWERRLADVVKVEEAQQSAVDHAADGRAAKGQAGNGQAANGQAVDGQAADGQATDGQVMASDERPAPDGGSPITKAGPSSAGLGADFGSHEDISYDGLREWAGTSNVDDFDDAGDAGPCALLAVASRRSALAANLGKRTAEAAMLDVQAGTAAAHDSSGLADDGTREDISGHGACEGQQLPKKHAHSLGKRKLAKVLDVFQNEFTTMAADADAEAAIEKVKGLVTQLLQQLKKYNQNQRA